MITTVEDDIEVAKLIANRIRQKGGDCVLRIVFFGSRAKGTAKPYSDYDILVVLEQREAKLIDEIYDVLLEMELEREIDISLKIYSQKKYDHAKTMGVPFIKNVNKTGITV